MVVEFTSCLARPLKVAVAAHGIKSVEPCVSARIEKANTVITCVFDGHRFDHYALEFPDEIVKRWKAALAETPKVGHSLFKGTSEEAMAI